MPRQYRRFDKAMVRALKRYLPRKYIACRGPGTRGGVALTFDDGPVADSVQVLETLRERNCRATFFLIGDRIGKSSKIVEKMVTDGHEIGNHSYSHPLEFASLGLSELARQFAAADEEVIKIAGDRPRFVRPPFGAITFNFLRYLRMDGRWPAVLWSSAPCEDQVVFDETGNRMVADVTRHAPKPGDILLLHAAHGGTIETLPALLDRLEELNLTPMTMSELLGIGDS